MKKQQLQKIWKQLDGACEAIEHLQKEGHDQDSALLQELVALKNEVEEKIEAKTRKSK